MKHIISFIILLFSTTSLIGCLPVCMTSKKDITDYKKDNANVYAKVTCKEAIPMNYCNSPSGKMMLKQYCPETVRNIQKEPGIKNAIPDIVQFCNSASYIMFAQAQGTLDLTSAKSLRSQVNFTSLKNMCDEVSQQMSTAVTVSIFLSWGTIKGMMKGYIPKKYAKVEMIQQVRQFYDVLELFYKLHKAGLLKDGMSKMIKALFKGVTRDSKGQDYVLDVDTDSFVQDWIRLWPDFMKMYKNTFLTRKSLTMGNDIDLFIDFYERMAGMNTAWGWDSHKHIKVMHALASHRAPVEAMQVLLDILEDLGCDDIVLDPLFIKKIGCRDITGLPDSKDNQPELSKALSYALSNCDTLIATVPCKPSPSEFPLLYICPFEFQLRCPSLLDSLKTSDVYETYQMTWYAQKEYANMQACFNSCQKCNYILLSNWTLAEDASGSKGTAVDIGNSQDWDSTIDNSQLADANPRYRLMTKQNYLKLDWINTSDTCTTFAQLNYCNYNSPRKSNLMADHCSKTIFKLQLAKVELKKLSDTSHYEMCRDLTRMAAGNRVFDIETSLYTQFLDNVAYFREIVKLISGSDIYKLSGWTRIKYELPGFIAASKYSLKSGMTKKSILETDIRQPLENIRWAIKALQNVVKTYQSESSHERVRIKKMIATLLGLKTHKKYKSEWRIYEDLHSVIDRHLPERLDSISDVIVGLLSNKGQLRLEDYFGELLEVFNRLVCPTDISGFQTQFKGGSSEKHRGKRSPESSMTLVIPEWSDVCKEGDAKRVFTLMAQEGYLEELYTIYDELFRKEMKCYQALETATINTLSCLGLSINIPHYKVKDDNKKLVQAIKSELTSCKKIVDFFGCYPTYQYLNIMYFCNSDWLKKCANLNTLPSTKDEISSYVTKLSHQDMINNLVKCAVKGPTSQDCIYVVDGNYELVEKSKFALRPIETSTTTTTTKSTTTTSTPKPPLPMDEFTVESDEPMHIYTDEKVMTNLKSFINQKYLSEWNEGSVQKFCRNMISFGVCQNYPSEIYQYCKHTLIELSYDTQQYHNMLKRFQTCHLLKTMYQYENHGATKYLDLGHIHMSKNILNVVKDLSDLDQNIYEIDWAARYNGTYTDNENDSIQYIKELLELYTNNFNGTVKYVIEKSGMSKIFTGYVNLFDMASLVTLAAFKFQYNLLFDCANELSSEILQNLDCHARLQYRITNDRQTKTAVYKDEPKALLETLFPSHRLNCDKLVNLTGCYFTHDNLPVAYYCLKTYKSKCSSIINATQITKEKLDENLKPKLKSYVLDFPVDIDHVKNLSLVSDGEFHVQGKNSNLQLRMTLPFAPYMYPKTYHATYPALMKCAEEMTPDRCPIEFGLNDYKYKIKTQKRSLTVENPTTNVTTITAAETTSEPLELPVPQMLEKVNSFAKPVYSVALIVCILPQIIYSIY